MAIGVGTMLTQSGYATQAAGILTSYGNKVAQDERSIKTAQAQVKLDNALANRNYQLINEEQMAVMIAHGMDKAEIAREVRRNKAAVMAARGGSGSLSSASLRASLTNIARQGGIANSRKNLNYGAKLRNLQIERGNVGIQLAGNTRKAYNKITQSADITSTGLQLLKMGVSASKEFRKLNPETGMTSSPFTGTTNQSFFDKNLSRVKG